MGLIGNVKLALKVRAAIQRLKEDARMGHAKAGLFGLAAAVGTALVAEVSKVCPDIWSQWPAMLTAGVMAGIGVYLKSPTQPSEPPKA